MPTNLAPTMSRRRLLGLGTTKSVSLLRGKLFLAGSRPEIIPPTQTGGAILDRESYSAAGLLDLATGEQTLFGLPVAHASKLVALRDGRMVLASRSRECLLLNADFTVAQRFSVPPQFVMTGALAINPSQTMAYVTAMSAPRTPEHLIELNLDNPPVFSMDMGAVVCITLDPDKPAAHLIASEGVCPMGVVFDPAGRLHVLNAGTDNLYEGMGPEPVLANIAAFKEQSAPGTDGSFLALVSHHPFSGHFGVPTDLSIQSSGVLQLGFTKYVAPEVFVERYGFGPPITPDELHSGHLASVLAIARIGLDELLAIDADVPFSLPIDVQSIVVPVLSGREHGGSVHLKAIEAVVTIFSDSDELIIEQKNHVPERIYAANLGLTQVSTVAQVADTSLIALTGLDRYTILYDVADRVVRARFRTENFRARHLTYLGQ